MYDQTQSTTDAQPVTIPATRREEADRMETLTAEAEAVERSIRAADNPDAIGNAELGELPTCPLCGDANCTVHTER